MVTSESVFLVFSCQTLALGTKSGMTRSLLSSAGLIPPQSQLAKMVQIHLSLLYTIATITPALAHPFARSVLACLTSEYAHSKLFHLVARTPASAVRLVGVFIMEIPMFCEKYTCLL